MNIVFIAIRIDEQEWGGTIFSSARDAYDHIKNRAISEERPISDYFVKLIEIQVE